MIGCGAVGLSAIQGARLDDYVTSRIGLDDINTGLARLREGQDIHAVVLM